MEVRILTEELSSRDLATIKDLGDRRWRNMSEGIMTYRTPTADLRRTLDAVVPGWIATDAKDTYSEFQPLGERRQAYYNLSYVVTLPLGSTEDQVMLTGLAILAAETASESH